MIISNGQEIYKEIDCQNELLQSCVIQHILHIILILKLIKYSNLKKYIQIYKYNIKYCKNASTVS